MPTVNGYVRGSRHEQEETLIVQRESIEREAAHKFPTLPLKLWVDQGVSGKRPFLSRPRGVLLNAALEPGDIIILHKLDRGFRNVRDMLTMLETWEARGVRLLALDFAIDTGTPLGKFFLTMVAAFAEFERARISERNLDVIRSRRARGLLCGQVPWGFRVEVTPGPDGKKEKRVVPCPYTRALGKKIIELVDHHSSSYNELYWHFRQNNIVTAANRPLSRSVIHSYYHQERKLQAIEALRAQQQGATQAPPSTSSSTSSSGGNTLDQ